MLHVSVRFSIYSASAPLFLPPATVAEKAEFPWALGSGPARVHRVPGLCPSDCESLALRCCFSGLWLFGVFEGPQGGCSGREPQSPLQVQDAGTGIWGSHGAGVCGVEFQAGGDCTQLRRLAESPRTCPPAHVWTQLCASSGRYRRAGGQQQWAQQSGETVSYGRRCVEPLEGSHLSSGVKLDLTNTESYKLSKPTSSA